MANFALKILIWTKISLLSLFALYGVLFLLMNEKAVDIWVFPYHTYTLGIVQLILCTMIFTVILSLLLWAGWRTIRQMHDLKQRDNARKIAPAPTDQEAKAALPATQPASTTGDSMAQGNRE